MTWPAICLWVMVAVGTISRGPLLLYVSAIAVSFGSLQMIPGDYTGSTNILPASIAAICLSSKILLRQSPTALMNAALDYRRLGIFTAYFSWSVFSAYAMPRLFAGVEVIPLAVEVPWPVPLQPSSANLTQPAYLAISLFSALAGYFAAANQAFTKHWLQALVVGGIALVTTGFIDLAFSAVGLNELLTPFRNTTYTLLATAEVLGSKRIVGLMPEASQYGSACVYIAASLCFLRPCYEGIWAKVLVPLTIAGLFLFALMSTSSAAYVGLAAFGLLYPLNMIRRTFSKEEFVRRGLGVEAGVLATGAIGVIVVMTFTPAILNSVNEALSSILFTKASSSSFEERNMWTQTGLHAYFDTYGFGVGFGSARTSNWFVAILSNSGTVGSVLLAAFILKTLLLSKPQGGWWDSEFVTGLRYSFLPNFVLVALIGTTPDVPNPFALGMLVKTTEDKSLDEKFVSTESMAVQYEGSASG